MSYRLAGSLLFLTFPLLAQQQDPDKPKATPEQQLKELGAEKDRLQREIQYAKDRVLHAKDLLRNKLGGQPQSWRSIDAGVNAPIAPPAGAPVMPKQTTARVATPEQMGDFPNDTIALVNGRPITQSGVDRLLGYLRTTPGGLTEQQQAERAMYELLRIEAVAAAFEEQAANERAATAAASLHDGRPIAEIVKEYGTCQGASPEGKVEVMHNSIFGPMVEMMAFSTKPGTNSVPFRTANGVMIFHPDSVEKGASPELDKVIGHAVQIPYTAEEAALQKAHLSVNMGQVDIVVKDDKTLALLPPMFRPVAPGQPGIIPANVQVDGADAMPDDASIKQALHDVETAIEKMHAAGDAGSKDQVKALELQRDQLRARLQQAQAQQQPATIDDPAAISQMMQQIQAELKKLAPLTDPASQTKVKELQQRYAELKQAMRAATPPAKAPEAPAKVEAPKK